jgi:hypothetical protein
MKSNIIRLVVMFAIGAFVYHAPRIFRQDAKTMTTKDAALNSEIVKIRDEIYQAQQANNLTQLRKSLALLEKNKTHESFYWQAYINYQLALKTFKENKNESQELSNRAKEILKNMDAKSSEDFALESMISGFSINFASFYEVASIANDAKRFANQAISLDSTNMRAYLALGINDFYTPAMFGGMKNSEELFKKSLALSAFSESRSINWGKELAQDFLNKFYEKKKQPA